MAELVWVYSLAGQQVAALNDLLALEIDERLQESETLSFTVRADDPKADYLSEDIIVRYGSRHYRIAEIELARAGSRVAYRVLAEALWIDLLGYPATTEPVIGATISHGLDIILADTPWTAGTVEADGGEFSLNVEVDSTVLAHIRAWASMTGREVIFDTEARTVSLALAQGQDLGLGFRYGRNLVAIKRKSRPPVATRLYAFGAEALSISSVHPEGLPYVEDFSFYTGQGISLEDAQALYLKVARFEDSRYLLPLNLYDAAVARLATLSQPQVSYELEVMDLAAVTGSAEAVGLGDVVRVNDAPTGISIATRVVRRVIRPLEPAKNAVELGYLQAGLGSSTNPTSSGSGSSEPEMRMLVDLNPGALNISGSLTILGGIALGVADGGVANLIFNLNLDATATGTGTVTVTFWYGATQVGPTVAVPFTAGPVHISANDFLVGINSSASLTARAQVTAGSGTLTVGANASHMYVLGSGLAGAGVETNPVVVVAEPVVTFAAGVADAGVTHALDTPIGVSAADSAGSDMVTVTDTVTATTTP